MLAWARKGRRIESILSQLVERYRAKRVWATDRWNLTSRWLRKFGSNSMPCYLCQKGGQCSSPLRFSDLLVDLEPAYRVSQTNRRHA